jgi:hypothetical protein
MKLKESEDEEDLDEEEAEEPAEEPEAEAEESETVVVETDNVGDPSVEINVEALIHELEVEGIGQRPGSELAARRRLEELMERKRAQRELEDFDDYDV